MPWPGRRSRRSGVASRFAAELRRGRSVGRRVHGPLRSRTALDGVVAPRVFPPDAGQLDGDTGRSPSVRQAMWALGLCAGLDDLFAGKTIVLQQHRVMPKKLPVGTPVFLVREPRGLGDDKTKFTCIGYAMWGGTQILDGITLRSHAQLIAKNEVSESALLRRHMRKFVGKQPVPADDPLFGCVLERSKSFTDGRTLPVSRLKHKHGVFRFMMSDVVTEVGQALLADTLNAASHGARAVFGTTSAPSASQRDVVPAGRMWQSSGSLKGSGFRV